MRFHHLKSVYIIVLALLILQNESNSQDLLRLYCNAGYVTNFKADPDHLKADAGASIRIGVLNVKEFGHGRMGYYAGYLWFQEYPEDNAEYTSAGSVLMAGIDFLLFKKGNSRWYVKLGLGNEKYTSTYRTRLEVDRGFIPDFGVLYNIKNINVYAGWQPSDPHHLNLGLGYTFN